MDVLQVCPFVTVHQSKAVETLHSVGGHTTSWSDVVLWFVGHVLKQLLEPLSLRFAGEGMLAGIGFTTALLHGWNDHVHVISYVGTVVCYIMYLCMEAPAGRVVFLAVVREEIQDALREGRVRIVTVVYPL